MAVTITTEDKIKVMGQCGNTVGRVTNVENNEVTILSAKLGVTKIAVKDLTVLEKPYHGAKFLHKLK